MPSTRNLELAGRAHSLLAALAVALAACVPIQAAAQTPPATPAELEEQVRQFALEAGAVPGVRLEVQVGALDTRLRLAPCERVEPYLPAGTRMWGRTRIGLRCTQGVTKWNVYLPLTVRVFGQGLVAAGALKAGAVLTAADLRPAEVDLADGSPALVSAEAGVGRTLARSLLAGQSVRQGDLRARQWFAAGDTVQVVAVGAGFSVTGEGQALGPGLEGQPTRVRTEAGRVVVGLPVGARRLEVSL